MADMFESYDSRNPHDFPNNRAPFDNYEDKMDSIIIGGTSLNTFKLNFKYSKFCNKLEVVYKQSISHVLTKYMEDIKITEYEDNSIIEVELSPEDTKLFSPTRTTKVQLKCYFKTGQILFSDIYQIETFLPVAVEQETETRL